MSSTQQKLRLGQLLLNRQAITQRQLAMALRLQKEKACQLGEALIAMGAIDQRTLKRVLRQQRWLRPAATCVALLSPFSMTYAYDPEETRWEINQQEVASQWYLGQDSLEHYSQGEQASRMLSTALDLYYGEPEAGEWRYSLSRTESQAGYQVEMRMFF